ncbi:MAG: AMIN domain-containing protein, partial [Propionivibrio sp.]|nr:AMIN domain-containing protein [Propionivibrio sp.]
MPRRDQKLSVTRRELIRFAGASLCMLVTPVGRAAIASGKGVLAVRVWPAEDYTRVAIEHSERLKFSHFTVKDPERLVVDLEGIEFN